jgi:hypothetical protein
MRTKTDFYGLGIASRRLLGVGLLALAAACSSFAYERYNSGCANCHGAFTGPTSPQNTLFPSGDKHRMHRNSANMGTACALCHSSGDNDDPFIGSSTGVPTAVPPVPGLGCSGCHNAAGLRAHHVANNVNCIGACHDPETPPAESVAPPYYGRTPYTKANLPGNPIAVANTNENWSVGDFLGLDNDGNNLYDAADFSCGPKYQLTQAKREGNNMRITWQTVGGRKDVVQVAPAVSGTYTNLSATITVPGVGVVTTNYLEIGGATNSARFYRIKYAP